MQASAGWPGRSGTLLDIAAYFVHVKRPVHHLSGASLILEVSVLRSEPVCFLLSFKLRYSCALGERIMCWVLIRPFQFPLQNMEVKLWWRMKTIALDL